MKKLVSTLLLAGLLACGTSAAVAAEDTAPKSVIHVVTVAWKDGTTPEQIQARCRAMLERTATRGGYALGTGNSIPEYVPVENYFAMIRTATDAV